MGYSQQVKIWLAAIFFVFISHPAEAVTLDEALNNPDIALTKENGKSKISIRRNLEQYATQDSTIKRRDSRYAARLVSGDDSDVLTTAEGDPKDPSQAVVRRMAFTKSGAATGNWTTCRFEPAESFFAKSAGKVTVKCVLVNHKICYRLKKAAQENPGADSVEWTKYLKNLAAALPGADDKEHVDLLIKESTKARDFYANQIGKAAWQLDTEKTLPKRAERQATSKNQILNLLIDAKTYAESCYQLGHQIELDSQNQSSPAQTAPAAGAQ